jgi:hypothetical protein
MSGYAEWSPATAYAVNDIVYWQGVVYVCVAININQQPPNVTYWAAQGGAAGVSSLQGLQGTVSLSSPDSSVGIAVVGQDIQLTAAAVGGVSSLNGATGAVNLLGGPGIGLAVAPGIIALSTFSSASAFNNSVSINAAGGASIGSSYTVPATGLYILSIIATFGTGAGATPVELDESLGNYAFVRFRNTPPGGTFDGFVNIVAPPRITAASSFVSTTSTTVVNWVAGVSKQFQVLVVNSGAGGISWDTASSSVAVTIVRLA